MIDGETTGAEVMGHLMKYYHHPRDSNSAIVKTSWNAHTASFSMCKAQIRTFPVRTRVGGIEITSELIKRFDSGGEYQVLIVRLAIEAEWVVGRQYEWSISTLGNQPPDINSKELYETLSRIIKASCQLISERGFEESYNEGDYEYDDDWDYWHDEVELPNG